MLEHLRAGDVAYDVGANYGIHTMLMARIAQGTGRVYAFEPMPRVYGALRENVGLNGFSNVTFVQSAVSDNSGREFFFGGDHDAAGHLAGVGEASGEKIEVTMTTLDEFVFEEGNRPPNFVKIDVEGAESKVLFGAARLLRELRPILLMDLHSIEQDIMVGKFLLTLGYQAYRAQDGVRVRDMTAGRPDSGGMPDQVLALPSD